MSPPLDLLPPLLSGLKITLELTLAGAALAVPLAFAAGLMRLSRFWIIRISALTYIEVFRGTSALIQLFWFYFVLPLLGVNLSAMMAGVLVLGLNTGAYGAVVVRSAVQGVARGQFEAAMALNLSRFQRMTRVILPQALVAMLPPWGNLFIELLKNTSLVSLITISELTFQGQIVRAETLRTTEVFGLVLLLYFIPAVVISRMVRFAERRLAFGMDHGGVR